MSEDPQRRLPEVGWQEREITFLVDLNPDGTPVAFSLLRETQAKGRRRAPLLLVPQEPKRKGPLPETATEKDCGRSSLFWDHPKYALGLPTEDGAKAIRDAEVCHGLFRLRHQQFAREGGAGIRNDAGMRALLSFLDRGATSGLSAIKPGWTNEVRESSGYVAFRLHGDRALVCRRSPIRAAISTQATSEDNSAVGQCLATGHTTRITRLHPSVQGVTGGLSTGAKLVTFNAPAANLMG